MIAPNDTIKAPAPGKKTDRQWSFGGSCFSAGPAGVGAYGVGSGGVTGPVMGVNGIWPGWGSLLCGSYGTYRAMMRQDTINFVMCRRILKVIASAWVLDAEEDAPEEAKEWVRRNIIQRRGEIIVHACRSAIYGNSPFEAVWTGGAKSWDIEQFVPLLPDNTIVMRGDNGNGDYDGLTNGQARLAAAESLYILNSGNPIGAEPGQDYGRSDLENIRDMAWVGWLDTARRLAELEDRVSGVLPIVIVPAGMAGNAKTYAENANSILPSLCHPRSQGGVIETPGLGEVDASTDPAKLKQLSTTVTTLDMGQRAASQEAMLNKLKYWDDKIARGLGQSERAVFATKGGTKADSGEHMESAEPGDEALDNSITAQINAQTIRTGLTLQFGPDVLKTIRGVKPVPLVDRDRAEAMALMNLFAQNANTAADFFAIIDGDKEADKAGIPLRMKWTEYLAQKQKRDDTAAKQAAANPPPASNGKQPLKLSDRMAERLERLFAA